MIKENLVFSRTGRGTYVSDQVELIDVKKNGTIGFVLTDLTNPFFALIVQSIEAKAPEKGYNVLFSYSSNNAEKEENQIRHFKSIGVSGLIIASMDLIHRATKAIRNLEREHFPYVMVSYVEDSDIGYVGTDHEKGAFIATEHLISLGYDRIGYINAEKGNRLGELRKQGYHRALSQYGKQFFQDDLFQFIKPGRDYQSGYQVGNQFLERNRKPDAVFAFNDLSALGFEYCLLEHGIRIPEDVALVGFDNIRTDLMEKVPLTTVHQPTKKIGELTVNHLIQQIEGKDYRKRIILEPHLVVRESCGSKIKK